MTHFASVLNANRNSRMLLLRETEDLVTRRMETVRAAIAVNGNVGGPFTIEAGDGLAEYRVGLGPDWSFVTSFELYKRLEWRCLSLGWNAVRVVNLREGPGVMLRLFSLLEPLIVEAVDIPAFHVTFQAPEGMADPSPITIDSLAQAVTASGAWRYLEDAREFVPPSRITCVRHVYVKGSTPT